MPPTTADHRPPGTPMGSNEFDGGHDDTTSKYMKHLRLALFSILLGGLGAQPASAEVPPEQAKMFADCKAEAEKGKPLAQFAIGMGYFAGIGVEADPAQGVKWLRKAADQGHAPAQLELGTCYAKGKGIERNEAEAVKWFGKAAEQGNPRAQFELGYCYYAGKGVQVDKTIAAPLLLKASQAGVADAHFVIGACYRFGRGVPKDLVEAYAYYTLAELASDDPRMVLFNLLKEKMSPEEMAKGDERAKELRDAIKARRATQSQGK